MEILKAYKVRIYPSTQQEQLLRQTIGACRFVYNYYLNIQANAYLQTGRNIPYVDLSRDLTKLRNDGIYPWLKDVQAAAPRQSLRQLDAAYSSFFRGKAKQPRFKSKNDIRQSFSKSKDWRIRDGRVQVQQDLLVKYRGTLPPEGAQLRTLTVSVTKTGKWYASILAVQSIEMPKTIGSVGVDLGLTHTAITSNGEKFDNLRLHKAQLKRLKLLQQSLSRKRKGSSRREKAKLEVARLHEKIANQRTNHLHQVSSALTSKNHALIAVEDLAVANMLKNHRLSRSISDVGWGELLRQIEYKQRWRGGRFVKVNRFFPSSKTCSSCRFVNQDMLLSIRQWACPNCDTKHDRDVNAALNILTQAEAQLSVESTEDSRKVKVTGSLKRGHALHDVGNRKERSKLMQELRQ